MKKYKSLKDASEIEGLIRMQLQTFVMEKERRLVGTSGIGNKSWPFHFVKKYWSCTKEYVLMRTYRGYRTSCQRSWYDLRGINHLLKYVNYR